MLELHDSPEVTEAEYKTSLQVRKIDNWATLERLSPTWNLLVEKSLSNNFFLTWEWLSCWWKAYGGGKELFVLVCSSDGGEIVGIAPLYRSHMSGALGIRSLQLIGDGSDDADNFDFIIQEGCERACITAFLDWLSDNGADWELLELNSVSSGSRSAQELLSQISDRGWEQSCNWTPRCVVPLPSSWDEYLQRLSTKTRSDWRRKLKRAQNRFKIGFQRCGTQDEIERGLRWLFELHQKSWRARGKVGKFALAQRRMLYCSVAQQAFQKGWLDLWVLTLDGVPAAVQFGITYGDTTHVMLPGFDPAYAEYGAGTLAQIHQIQRLMHRGCRRYDFLGGQDPYKLQFRATQEKYLRLRCARARTRVAFLLAAEKSAGRSKEWLRKRLPAASWQVLKKVKRAATLRAKSGELL